MHAVVAGGVMAVYDRPAFHITPVEYFMNDPDGPFYDDNHKLFHLFVGGAWQCPH